ncbi:MAG: phosphatidate cytidylyltransferase [Clostridia bacterium]|nr:phosphatidate cytidylyltransferase [Clostridia bacterium]
MKNKFLQRVVTGAVLVAIVVGFFFLRLVKVDLFSILTALFIVVGTYELSSKLFLFKYTDGVGKIQTDGTSVTQFSLTMVASFLIVPAFEFFGAVTMLSLIFSEALVTSIVAIIGKKGFNGVGKGWLSAVYPKALLSSLLFSNALGANALFALILSFIVPSFTDTFAYLVGSALKGPKLCPKVSPNKTVSGAIGGLLGGIVAAVALYFIVTPITSIKYDWIIFICLGIVCSVLTQIGDIFESYIKRRIGVKDMGNILPGHGGVLDRVDGIMFASVVIAITMGVIANI